MAFFYINVVIFFLIFLSSHQVFTGYTNYYIIQGRHTCIRDISKFFRSTSVYYHGQYAIDNYTDTDYPFESSGFAKGYYVSFKPYLQKGNVLEPKEFCDQMNSVQKAPLEAKNECLAWLSFIFGTSALQAVITAFYTYDFSDIRSMKKRYPFMFKYNESNLKFYFTSIRAGYGLIERDPEKYDIDYMKTPEEYCDLLFPMPTNKDIVSYTVT